MEKLKPKPFQLWAWTSTITIMAGAFMAAFFYLEKYQAHT